MRRHCAMRKLETWIGLGCSPSVDELSYAYYRRMHKEIIALFEGTKLL